MNESIIPEWFFTLFGISLFLLWICGLFNFLIKICTKKEKKGKGK